MESTRLLLLNLLWDLHGVSRFGMRLISERAERSSLERGAHSSSRRAIRGAAGSLRSHRLLACQSCVLGSEFSDQGDAKENEVTRRQF